MTDPLSLYRKSPLKGSVSSLLTPEQIAACDELYQDFFSGPGIFKIRQEFLEPAGLERASLLENPRTSKSGLSFPILGKPSNPEIRDLSSYSRSLLESQKTATNAFKTSQQVSIDNNASFSREIVGSNLKYEENFECNPSDQALFSDLLRKENNVQIHIGNVSLNKSAEKREPSLSPCSSPSRRNWNKVLNVMTSVNLLRKSEVSVLSNLDQVEKELKEVSETARLRKVSQENRREEVQRDRPLSTDVFTKAMNSFNRHDKFFECCERGSHQDVLAMEKILRADPKKFLRDKSDPDHFINRRSPQGLTPLYVACKNGNLEVIEFLIKNSADPNILSQIELKKPILESPLEVAIRKVIRILLDSGKLDNKALITAQKSARSKSVKELIRQKLKH